MRKVTLGFIFLIFGLDYSNAQIGKHIIGVEVGPSLCFVTGSKNYGDFLPNFGFCATLSYNYKFNDFFSFHTGTGVEQKGFIFVSSFPYNTPIKQSSVSIIAKNNLYYLNTPFLLKWTLTHPIQLFANFGGYLGYRFAQYQSKKFFEYTNYDFYLLAKSGIKTFDYGLSSGLGISIPYEKVFLFSFEIRYNRSLARDIIENTNNNSYYDSGSHLKNNSVNFIFGFSKKIGLSHSKDKTFYY